MLIADRTNDATLAETAAAQIETAYETCRDGGQAQWAAFYDAQLPKARAIRDRLKGKSGRVPLSHGRGAGVRGSGFN